jgi:predicted RNA methylase
MHKHPKTVIPGLRLQDGSVSRGVRSEMTRRKRHAAVALSLDLSDKCVLDLGCDQGLYSLYMAGSAKTVIGVDRNREAIQIAEHTRQVLGIKNARFVAGDINTPSIQDSLPEFDLVVMWGFLHRIPDVFTVLSGLATRTKAFSLEWQTVIFPHMQDRAIAVYPKSQTPEPGNLFSLHQTMINSGAKDYRILQNHFWSPTPAAVESILSDLGFPHSQVVGYGDDLATQQKALDRKFRADGSLQSPNSQPRLYPPDMAPARVHMLSMQVPSSVRFGRNSISSKDVPAWDVDMRKTFGKNTLTLGSS